MKTEVKHLDKGKKELAISVSGDLVKNKFEEVFKQIGETAKVPGFRPGHAPRDILEKNFSGAAHEQVLKELIPDIYDRAVQQEGIDVIDLPEISEVKLDRLSLSFKAVVEVRPEVQVKDYKGIKVNYKKIGVTAEDIKRVLDSLKESRKLAAVDDSLGRALGYPSLAELEKVIEKQLFLEKTNAERQNVEQQIIDTVSKGLTFNLPQRMVSRQLGEMVRQAKVDLAMKGLSKEAIEQEEKGISEKLLPEAEKQVRVYLILAAIAKKENIPIDEHLPRKVIEFLLQAASWQENQ